MQDPSPPTLPNVKDLFNEPSPPVAPATNDDHPLLIKLKPKKTVSNPLLPRRSSRHRSVNSSEVAHQEFPATSGSEYQASEKSIDADGNADGDGEDEEEAQAVEFTSTQRGRRIVKKSYKESASEDDGLGLDDDQSVTELKPATRSRVKQEVVDDDDDEEDGAPRRLTRRSARVSKQMNDFIEEDEEPPPSARYSTRSRSRKPPAPAPHAAANGRAKTHSGPSERARRLQRRSARAEQEDGDFKVDEHASSGGSASGDASMEDAPRTSSDVELDAVDAAGEVDAHGEEENENDGRPYALRQRSKVNYVIPTPLEEMPQPLKPKNTGGRAGGVRGGARNGRKGPGWSATGAELGRWMGLANDDSDSDGYNNTRTPRKPFGSGIFSGGAIAGAGGSGLLPADLAAAAGTPSNLGRIGDAALADADPLGVNQNVTFDEVGGLDDHIHALKEMTVLPLLYPEVFQRFDVTPPRGVLFHGPPGTGKTLLARALAASCRTNGKQIAFFMRKGADCLSKWVGEAERQLRLLFEEARASQPSIIFFDEIDGLAPVRSSKQDQIHASIVSTLLALMDGMDGRGQVVVIGATNRPDAVDPALRRPGRFDREFYFPLPKLEAREKILRIMTRKWAGWDGERGEENVKGLAKLTKGYGGADLRALCTEATLNAIQRRYPQIYKSSDRLLLKPDTIEVGLRDFMISVKKLVPSSARSASSSASPLPDQLVPLLSDALERVKAVIRKVLPDNKQRTALEEAEYEEESEEGALARELQLQAVETLRVYRPRAIVCGPPGMGQGYIGAAVLHHLEGYHVQSLELGTLMSDSTRTVEAAIVQLFVEAKRHQPSVVYIPSLIGWCAAVSEVSRSTVRSMLDTLAPTDPILLLAVVDGPWTALPRDVRAWFGPTRDARVELLKPTAEQRQTFFEPLIKDIRRPPNEFADGVKRKKRVLEQLPVAPPLEPRQPTAAELAVQTENDQRTITLLKYRLGPILSELKRKFKRFTKRATEEYNFDPTEAAPVHVETVTTTTAVEVHTGPNGTLETIAEQTTEQTTEQIEPQVNGFHGDQSQAQMQMASVPYPPLYDMDLERMHVELYKGRYLTPKEFLDDVGKIVHNAEMRMDEDPDRYFKAQAMFTAAEVSIQDFDPQLRQECERMAVREARRRDEQRKAKEKERGPQNGASAAPQAIRRSARHNGQQPDFSPTDPLMLERKLKRQRSDEAAAESHGSDQEGNAAKKPKIVEMDDDRDPIDLLGAPESEPRPTAVRFAPDAMAMEIVPSSSPLHANGAPGPSFDPQSMPMTPRRQGFDPALLNPLLPLENPFSRIPYTPHALSPLRPQIPSTPHNAFAQFPFGQPPSVQVTPFHNPADVSAIQSPQTPGILAPQPAAGETYGITGLLPFNEHFAPPKTPPRTPAADREPTLQPSGEQPLDESRDQPAIENGETMDVERPATPLPAFHVSEDEIDTLTTVLRSTTGSLAIEQLEQLRAACLTSIWSHRTDWDRDALVLELGELVKEFVEAVALDDTDLGLQEH